MAALKCPSGVFPDKVVSSPLGRAMDTAQLVAWTLRRRLAEQSSPAKASSSAATAPSKRADALPTDVWDPGEELVPFGGEGSQALQERMVGTLTNLMAPRASKPS